MRRTVFILVCFLSFLPKATARPDSAHVRYAKLFGKDQIIIQENDIYLVEYYTYFKYMYGLYRRDTISAIDFRKKQYARNWTSKYKHYSICDPKVNRIRNEGAMSITFTAVCKTAEDRLGKNNWFTRNHVFHWLLQDGIYEPNCFNDFKKIEVAYKDRWLAQIDSVKNSIR